ncbi:hypothetical protein [Thalassobacillus sp. C254]|nr:hypothetical protein [Thalassobacillus sp. C254]
MSRKIDKATQMAGDVQAAKEGTGSIAKRVAGRKAKSLLTPKVFKL